MTTTLPLVTNNTVSILKTSQLVEELTYRIQTLQNFAQERENGNRTNYNLSEDKKACIKLLSELCNRI